MISDPFGTQRLPFASILNSPFLDQKSSARFHSKIGLHVLSNDGKHGIEHEAPGSPPSYCPTNDYVVGKADTRHAVMVDQFLRLLCKETPTQAADAVVLVDIPGRIYGYGYRRDSSLVGLLTRLYASFITDALAEDMKRRWLNRNIECIALQQRHWRLFRLYDTEATYTVLMEFHPVEMQRTALVVWMLQDDSSPQQ